MNARMVLRPRNGLSLCAGGGGLDMGLMLAEPGFHTRAFVEWEEYPRSVIIAAQRAGYFASAPIWDDLTTFDARPFAGCIDTLLAGYPCQPFSHAGQRKGADDERHLWPDVARIVGEVEPEWVFLENVAGHVSLGAETVLQELRDMGYTPAAGLFSAAETGAPHERLRWFCVAHRDGDNGRADRRQPNAGTDWGHLTGWGSSPLGHAQSLGRGEGRAEPEVRGGRDTASGAGRTMADTDGGNASTEGLQRGGEQRFHPEGGRSGGRGDGISLADASGGSGHQGRPSVSGSGDGPRGSGETTGPGGSRPYVHPPGPADMGRWADVLVKSPDLAPSASFGDLASFAGQVAAMAQAGLVAEAEIEPALRRMADGLALRSRALRLLGNGVHPLAAGHAWRTLSSAHGLRPLDLVAASAEDGAGTDGALVMADQWGGWAEEQMRVCGGGNASLSQRG